MKKLLLALPLLGTFTSCSMLNMVNESTSAIQANREAVEMSTYAIYQNIEAIERANRAIDENKRKLEEINAEMTKAHES